MTLGQDRRVVGGRRGGTDCAQGRYEELVGHDVRFGKQEQKEN